MERPRFVPPTTDLDTSQSSNLPQIGPDKINYATPHRRTLFDWMRSRPTVGVVGALSAINLTFGALHEAEAKTTKKSAKTTKKPTRRTTTTLKKNSAEVRITSTTTLPQVTRPAEPSTTITEPVPTTTVFLNEDISTLHPPYTYGPGDINPNQCWTYYKPVSLEWKHINGRVAEDTKFNSRGCVYIAPEVVLNSTRLYSAPPNQYLVVADDGAGPLVSWGVELPKGGWVVNFGQWEEAVKKIAGGDVSKIVSGGLQKAVDLRNARFTPFPPTTTTPSA